MSGFVRVSVFRFGSGSGSKKVRFFPWVSGFRVSEPITKQGSLPFVHSFAKIQVHVDRKPVLKFLNYEHNTNKTGAVGLTYNGIDTISFEFNLKLTKGRMA